MDHLFEFAFIGHTVNDMIFTVMSWNVSYIYRSISDRCESIWIQIYMFCTASHNHYTYMPSIYLRNVKITTANWHIMFSND